MKSPPTLTVATTPSSSLQEERNSSRPPRMCNGRDALLRVRCLHAVFGRVGARPSRCRGGTESQRRRDKVQDAVVILVDVSENLRFTIAFSHFGI